MFRFSIRELLLLTVIVGLGAGWAVGARQFSAQLMAKDREISAKEHELLVWANRTKVMVSCFKEFDCKVLWDDDSIAVSYRAPDGSHAWQVSGPTDPGQFSDDHWD